MRLEVTKCSIDSMKTTFPRIVTWMQVSIDWKPSQIIGWWSAAMGANWNSLSIDYMRLNTFEWHWFKWIRSIQIKLSVVHRNEVIGYGEEQHLASSYCWKMNQKNVRQIEYNFTLVTHSKVTNAPCPCLLHAVYAFSYCMQQ